MHNYITSSANVHESCIVSEITSLPCDFIQTSYKLQTGNGEEGEGNSQFYRAHFARLGSTSLSPRSIQNARDEHNVTAENMRENKVRIHSFEKQFLLNFALHQFVRGMSRIRVQVDKLLDRDGFDSGCFHVPGTVSG